MATRSTIAVQHADGTVSQIYCHFDGYLAGNGTTLQQHYNSLELAEALVAGGDMSALATTIAGTEYYTQSGEELNICKFATILDYARRRQDEEYNYLFLNGQWFVDDTWGDRGGEYIPLAESLGNA